MSAQGLRLHRWELLLGAGMLAMLAFLAWRNHGLMPYVFADELSYSMFSRLMPLREAIVPSYLYLWLFSASSACGPGFLECVRYGNEVLFVAAAPFIYLTARRVCSKPAALAVALVALAGPVNSYTAYFMPESTYFFGFSVLAWASLAPGASWRRLGLSGGIVIGLLALVKVHALFLMPAQCLFVFAACRMQGGRWWWRGAGAAGLTIAVMLAVRFALGYAFAGKAGLHLFGSLYGNQAQGNAGKWASFIPYAWANLQGHLMAMSLLLAFPLAVLCRAPFEREGRPCEVSALQLYAFLMLGASLGMAVLYTASLYASEGLRVHMRYYDFTFPLLFMVGAASAHWPRKPRSWLGTAPPALAAIAGIAWSWRHLGVDFNLLMGDGAEAAAMVRDNPLLPVLAAAGIAVLVAWVLRPALGARLFVFAFLPFFALHTAFNVLVFQRQLSAPTPYDAAGMFARAYLAPQDRAALSITGGPIPHLMRAKFHADAAEAKMLDMREEAPLDASLVPSDSKWLLVVGKHALPPGMQPVVANEAYALVRLPEPARRLARVDLTSVHGDVGSVESLEGMSQAEPWGRWSDGGQVRLVFRTPLPRTLIVVLGARAFGPNAGKEFIVRIGAQEQRFAVEETERQITLRFDTDGAQKVVTIEVPQPTMPTRDGKVIDGRRLGIGLSEVVIATQAEGAR